METGFFQFTVGNLQCTLITDGKHAYADPKALLFPDAPEAELASELAMHGISADNWPCWVSDYTCLLIDTGKRKILLDTGAGEMLPEAGKVVENMRAAGISPESVDCVLISHAHPDHVGGAGYFPDARIVMSHREWQFWTGSPTLPRLPDDFRNLLTGMVSSLLAPLRERVELVDGDTEIAPGIRLVEAPGHTPGHMALLAASRGEHLIYAGDAVIHKIHIRNLQWSPLVDVLPDESTRTRNRLLSEAADNRAVFVGFHLPHAGKISRDDAGFAWHQLVV
ncbi:MBL fold metallo-hydrolase [Oceanidesulfovibrio marinus]|uniref:MBL fold metallo-hydrolase n=1 Tax=Oceanidesulfovibrio marinus TaxID=370038 RepID=A0ABX6NHV5_9BACT|nr:MBL fold metallo-hydrolase [Oceanidesulfovibrio marinus]QJT09290.1 MBL fold metallo-hydrolase [Oceanidesulfovibrio marinus]